MSDKGKEPIQLAKPTLDTIIEGVVAKLQESLRKALDPQAQAKVSSQQNYSTDHKQLNTYSYVCKIHVNACSCTHGRTNNDHKQKYNTG